MTGTDPTLAALVAAIIAAPDDDLPRLALADHLAETGGEALAAVMRDRLDPLACRRAAAVLEHRLGLHGLASFARLSCELEAHPGELTGAMRRMADVAHRDLTGGWRVWLPRSVTTLKKAHGAWGLGPSGVPNGVVIPSRRARHSWGDVIVLFSRGLPDLVECHDVDWARCGADVMGRFPWVRRARSETPPPPESPAEIAVTRRPLDLSDLEARS